MIGSHRPVVRSQRAGANRTSAPSTPVRNTKANANATATTPTATGRTANANATGCEQCKVQFGFWHKRYHCGICTTAVCSSCSKRVRLPNGIVQRLGEESEQQRGKTNIQPFALSDFVNNQPVTVCRLCYICHILSIQKGKDNHSNSYGSGAISQSPSFSSPSSQNQSPISWEKTQPHASLWLTQGHSTDAQMKLKAETQSAEQTTSPRFAWMNIGETDDTPSAKSALPIMTMELDNTLEILNPPVPASANADVAQEDEPKPTYLSDDDKENHVSKEGDFTGALKEDETPIVGSSTPLAPSRDNGFSDPPKEPSTVHEPSVDILISSPSHFTVQALTNEVTPNNPSSGDITSQLSKENGERQENSNVTVLSQSLSAEQPTLVKQAASPESSSPMPKRNRSSLLADLSSVSWKLNIPPNSQQPPSFLSLRIQPINPHSHDAHPEPESRSPGHPSASPIQSASSTSETQHARTKSDSLVTISPGTSPGAPHSPSTRRASDTSIQAINPVPYSVLLPSQMHILQASIKRGSYGKEFSVAFNPALRFLTAKGAIPAVSTPGAAENQHHQSGEIKLERPTSSSSQITSTSHV